MRAQTMLLSLIMVVAGSAIAPLPGAAAPLVLAQAEGGGIGGSIGGSIASPNSRTVETRPRVRRPAAHRAVSPPRAASARPVVSERHVAHQPKRGDTLAAFDGVWSVSSGGGCSAAGTSQVMISGGVVMGQTGVSGHVSPDGAVSTVSSGNGLTVVGRGRISGRSASGIYQQSDGCSGSWNAVKL